MSHRHMVDRSPMVLPSTEASYIVVLGIVISVLPISSTLLQDGYHINFKQKTVNKEDQEPIKHRGSPLNKYAQSINLLSDGIPDGISSSDTISESISNTISQSISDSIKDSNSETNSNHSHSCTLFQDGGLRQWICEAVGKNLNSRYVAQVYLSGSSYISSKIELSCNVCNCSWVVDSVLDARDR
jgi:hypothetical protein